MAEAAAEAGTAAELSLLRGIALAVAEAAAAGTPLPGPLRDSLDAWLNGTWRGAGPPEADLGFTQGYLAALETAARHCSAAAESRGAVRQSSLHPLRRGEQQQAEAALRTMAAGLRLMAGGLQSHGG